jgi:hypothetical protein
MIAEVRARLDAAGFDLHGTLAAADYDALVPEAWKLGACAPGTRGVLIVGHAGRGLWPRFVASPEARLARDPLDAYARRAIGEAAQASTGASVALYSERRGGSYCPLVALAQRAGLGTPGRVGVLLHPRYGPWISLRALIFSREPLATVGPEPRSPCEGCPAPCAAACHGHAVSARDGLDGARCYASRLSLAPCALRCDARLACPVGAEHAYPPEQIAHHYRIRA